MDPYEHIEELIAKHLAEETSAAEEKALYDWMANSESNQLYYAEMKAIHEVTEKTGIHQTINLNAAWTKFSKTLEEPETKRTVVKKFSTSFFSKAAIFIGILTLGYTLYYLLYPNEEQVVLSSSNTAVQNNTLSDGTFVSLYPSSSISYSSSFNKKNRELQLSGEAYFHVKHNADLPFIIRTGDVFIKDVGTTFTVKANPSDSAIIVVVTEGEVIFYSTRNPGISLVKNETGIYNLHSKTFRKRESDAVPLNPETAVTLDFENTRLKLVIDTLNKVYNERIRLSCEKLESLELTASFKEKTAVPVIETIAETFGLSITRDNGNIILNSVDCKK